MKKALNIIARILIFSILTILTQVGGVAFVISEIIVRKWPAGCKYGRLAIFPVVYLTVTLLIVPLLAPAFGREPVGHRANIRPASYLTVLLNRNYVRPELNRLLRATAERLDGSDVSISYLDANFPFINEFPLLPHLSHNDGKKIDLSLIYEDDRGEVSSKQRSVSGYGVFEGPSSGETDQIDKCLRQGYWQYDFPKYLTFGTINRELQFSASGTKLLVNALLKQTALGKIFIEPHLKSRMSLKDNRIRYHGCRAVRHDDHIHVQL